MFREHVWGKLALDGIICAPQAVPALKLGQTWDLSPLAIGTFWRFPPSQPFLTFDLFPGTILYNVVDSVAGVLPVTFVDAEKDKVTPEWLARGEKGSTLVEGRVYGGKTPAYDSEQMTGLPVGVQIVGPAYQEEKVIQLMKLVDQSLGARGFGPGEFVKRAADK